MTNDAGLFQEVLHLYGQQGLKFTMDDVSGRMCISKKTLYEMVDSKEDLICKVIEHYFDLVDQAQDAIHAAPGLSSVERLRELLCATPTLEIRKYHLRELKAKYPRAFHLLDDRLRLGWERTFAVMDQAKSEGLVHADLDNQLFSKVYAGAVEELVMDNDIDSDLTFKQKQRQLVGMLLFGICTSPERIE